MKTSGGGTGFERRYTLAGGYRLHSVHAGTGEPVVLLHGLSGSHRWWLPAVERLARRYSVHVPELVGFGASRPAWRQPTIAQEAELILAWLTALGISRCALVGHSMGAQIAIHMAVSAPERLTRLILVSAAGIPRRLSFSEATRFLAEIVPPRSWGDRRFLRVIALDALRSGPLTLLQAARHVIATDIRPLLPEIRTPTLLLWGDMDPLTPLAHAHVMHEAIEGSRLHVLKGAAHVPMADRPEEFMAAVEAFLGDA